MNSENQSTDKSMESKNSVHKISVGNEDAIRNQSRGHPCYILAKKLCMFCPCPETLCEAKLKDDRLICQGEVSRLYNIQTKVWIIAG